MLDAWAFIAQKQSLEIMPHGSLALFEIHPFQKVNE